MTPRSDVIARRFCEGDSAGNAYPEFCDDTDRYDHNLGAHGLADNFEAYRRNGP